MPNFELNTSGFSRAVRRGKQGGTLALASAFVLGCAIALPAQAQSTKVDNKLQHLQQTVPSKVDNKLQHLQQTVPSKVDNRLQHLQQTVPSKVNKLDNKFQRLAGKRHGK